MNGVVYSLYIAFCFYIRLYASNAIIKICLDSNKRQCDKSLVFDKSVVIVLQESLFADADYMESNLGFTYDTDKYSDLPAFVTDLHSRGQRYMIVLVRLGHI